MSTRLLSQSRLAAPSGLLHRLCKQCDVFLESGLPFLNDKIAAKKFKRVDPRHVLDLESFGTPKDRDSDAVSDPKEPVQRPLFKPRAASAMEKELFHFHSLSVEQYIEGFIRGLEAAGIDRKSLSREAEIAVNNLLHILQTLAGERHRVHGDECNRADIRRLSRHIDDTSLMVNEYVRAVAEECLEPKRVRSYISSHGREHIESTASAPPK